MNPTNRAALPRCSDDEFLSLMKRALSEAFPNRERIDCPNRDLRTALATGRKDLREHWEVFDHVSICSPCFAEFLETRRNHLRRSWILRACGAGIFAIACAAGYVVWHSGSAATGRNNMAHLDGTIPTISAGQGSPTVAQLNFRQWTVTRGEQSSEPSSASPRPLRRGNLSLRIELPHLTPADSYRVILVTGSNKSWMDRTVEARIVDGHTILDPVTVDLTHAPPGPAMLLVERRQSSSFRELPIQLD